MVSITFFFACKPIKANKIGGMDLSYVNKFKVTLTIGRTSKRGDGPEQFADNSVR